MAGELKVYPNRNSPPQDSKVLTGTDEAGNKTALDVHITNDATSAPIPTEEQRSGVFVSTLNSLNAPLAALATFTGTAEDVRNYAETTINLYGEPAIAPGNLYFEYSTDGINWDVSVPYSLAGPQSFVPLPLRTVLPFFRVRYENGATPLTVFRMTVLHHWTAAKTLTRVINQQIDENEPVEMVRSISAGKSPDGFFENLPATGNVSSNTTNTPLGIGGIYTGAIESTAGFISASLTLASDVNSALSGVEIDWYADAAGTRLVKVSTFTYGSAPQGINISVPIQAPYFRVQYTNNSLAQTIFELITRLSVSPAPADVVAIGDTIGATNTATINKSQIVGQQENLVFANVALSNNASVKVAINDRPSELRGRTSVLIPLANLSVTLAPVLLHTVTPGTIFYLQSFLLSQLNDNAANGQWNINDNGTIRSGFLVPSRSGGTPAAAASSSPNLPEPIPFTTNVRATLVTGTINVSGFLFGYEEPI